RRERKIRLDQALEEPTPGGVGFRKSLAQEGGMRPVRRCEVRQTVTGGEAAGHHRASTDGEASADGARRAVRGVGPPGEGEVPLLGLADRRERKSRDDLRDAPN